MTVAAAGAHGFARARSGNGARCVVDRMDGVEPQPVEVVLGEPVERVVDEKFARDR